MAVKMPANPRGTQSNMDANQSRPPGPEEGAKAAGEISRSPASRETLKKRIRLAILCLLLVAGVLAAWEGHELFFHGRGDRQPSSGPVISSGTWDSAGASGLHGDAAETNEQWPASGPAAFPVATAGPMTPVDADPGGIAAPPGSLRLWSYRGKAGGLALENAKYESPCDLEMASGYYLAAMKERSYTCAGQKNVSPGRLVVVFIRDAAKVTLILQTDLSRNNMVTVFISVMRPPGQ
jgi:hypothetical protein